MAQRKPDGSQRYPADAFTAPASAGRLGAAGEFRDGGGFRRRRHGFGQNERAKANYGRAHRAGGVCRQGSRNVAGSGARGRERSIAARGRRTRQSNEESLRRNSRPREYQNPRPVLTLFNPFLGCSHAFTGTPDPYIFSSTSAPYVLRRGEKFRMLSHGFRSAHA